MAESKAVDIPERAAPYEPGEPREEPAISQFGATFAERQQARAKAEKAISGSSGGAENKAVKKATKKAAKKS